MNLLTALKPRQANNLAAVGKGSSLQKTATLTVPASLDWIIRRRIVRVWQQQQVDEYATETPREALENLNRVLGPYEHTADYQLTLYGHEWALLYAFLLEQFEWYFLWNQDVIPASIQRSTYADFSDFVDDLERLCKVVDVFAFRPVSGIS